MSSKKYSIIKNKKVVYSINTVLNAIISIHPCWDHFYQSSNHNSTLGSLAHPASSKPLPGMDFLPPDVWFIWIIIKNEEDE